MCSRKFLYFQIEYIADYPYRIFVTFSGVRDKYQVCWLKDFPTTFLPFYVLCTLLMVCGSVTKAPKVRPCESLLFKSKWWRNWEMTISTQLMAAHAFALLHGCTKTVNGLETLIFSFGNVFLNFKLKGGPRVLSPDLKFQTSLFDRV